MVFQLVHLKIGKKRLTFRLWITGWVDGRLIEFLQDQMHFLVSVLTSHNSFHRGRISLLAIVHTIVPFFWIKDQDWKAACWQVNNFWEMCLGMCLNSPRLELPAVSMSCHFSHPRRNRSSRWIILNLKKTNVMKYL